MILILANLTVIQAFLSVPIIGMEWEQWFLVNTFSIRREAEARAVFRKGGGERWCRPQRVAAV